MNNIFTAIKKFFRGRTLKYGANAFILIAAVVAVAVLVNVLVGMLDLKLDLTPNKIFSIGDVTKEILSKNTKDVTIYGLFDEGQAGASADYKEVVELLNLYSKYPNIKVEYVDPERTPGITRELDPDDVLDLATPDLVVKCGNKVKKLEYYDLFRTEYDQQTFQQYKTGSTAEQGITGAIKYVTADITPVVYFTEGHEEYELDSDLSNVKGYLERNNYDVKTVNLLTQVAVPEDAELLVVAGPQKDISTAENDKISAFLENGGKAIFMFDYLASDPAFNEFDDIFKGFNIALNYDRVKENDASRHYPDNPYVVILDVKRSDITSEEFPVILDGSRSIQKLKNEKEYIKVTSLMQSSSKGVGEQIDKSRGADIQGPLDIAVSVENNGDMKASKIIVMGNSYFITDDAASMYGSYYGNGMEFFLRSLNWMLDKEDEVVIAAKSYDSGARLTITEQQANVLGLSVVILLPLLILGAGLYVFLRRRHL